MWMSVEVNGHIYEREVAEHWTLLRFLREDLELTGTKDGCSAGECGACTVMLNGEAVNACMVLAVEADGAAVETIEAEAVKGELSEIQAAFARNFAVQCGYCTSGMVMSVRELLRRNPRPTLDEIKEGIEGNLCRCTGYQQIIEAVLDVSGQLDRRNKGGAEICLRPRSPLPTHVGENVPRADDLAQADRRGRLHERHGASRHAPCPGQKEPARPGEDRRHQHLQGREPPRGARRSHGQRARLPHRALRRGQAHARQGRSAALRRGRGRRRRREPGHRQPGRRSDRRRVRGTAAGTEPARGAEDRRAPGAPGPRQLRVRPGRLQPATGHEHPQSHPDPQR